MGIVGCVEGTADTVVDVLTELGGVGTFRIADLEAECTTAHEAERENVSKQHEARKIVIAYLCHSMTCVNWPLNAVENTMPPMGLPR